MIFMKRDALFIECSFSKDGLHTLAQSSSLVVIMNH